MHAGPGFRMLSEIERADADVIAGFAEFETPEISDLMNRLYTMRGEFSNDWVDRALEQSGLAP